jgi:hypothetical protein
MALSDKNIVITPAIGSTSADPKIVFSGASASLGPQNITLQVYPTSNGTLSFEGSAGQLFSISNSLSGTIFSVNDVSGIPSIEVFDTGEVRLAQYNGFVSILNTTQATSTITGALRVVGGVGIGGNLWVGGTINGSISGSASSTIAALTMNNSGSGAASGTTFDGSTARTISYNTIGALGSSQKAADSELLDGLDSTAFLRSNTATTWSATNGTLRVTTPAGSLGTTGGSVNTLEVFQATINTDAFMTFHISGDYAAHFGLDGTTNDLFYGGWSAGANKYRVIHTGNSSNVDIRFKSLGVGTAGSGTTGEIRATNEITAYYSDRRLKTDVRPISNAIEKVMSLNGIIYRSNDVAKEYGFTTDNNIVGLFADEVEAVLPEAVRPAPFDLDANNESKSGKNYKTIQYEKVVPLLVEAIKEQQTQINQILVQLENLANK